MYILHVFNGQYITYKWHNVIIAIAPLTLIVLAKINYFHVMANSQITGTLGVSR